MSRCWLNFARSGDPNGDGLTQWPRYSSEERAYLELGDAITVKHDPAGQSCELLAP